MPMSEECQKPELPVTAADAVNSALSLLEGNKYTDLQALLNSWGSGDIAALLEALPTHERRVIWSEVPDSARSETLACLSELARSSLLEAVSSEEAVAAVADMETPDLADVIDTVSDSLGEAILESLSASERSLVETTLAYPEDSAGRLMETDWIAVRSDVSLEVVTRYLRLHGEMPPHTDGLMVVDREGVYEGKLLLETLLTADLSSQVAKVMRTDADYVLADTHESDIATLCERRELLSLAVVDEERRLIGRIVIDDVIDIIRAEAEQPLLQMAGLQQGEDLFAPIMPSARRRMLWLGVNLATAFLASWAIGLFQETLDKIVALAVLMPIVASMGGITGSQTLTLAVRGLALGQITNANTRWLAIKEIAIAAINGLLWALVVALITWYWFDQATLALVIAVAMLLNMLTAAAAGLLVPLVLDRLGIDPALSGSVILTTVTDVVGFVSFLGLGTWLLL